MDVAMVQIVENHADISGALLDRADDPERHGFVRLTVKLETAQTLAPWPNLFERYLGQSFALLARADGSLAKTAIGQAVRVKAKMIGPGLAFAEEQ